jgi:outer membrane protein
LQISFCAATFLAIFAALKHLFIEMKNLPIALSGLSLVAVAILYYLHFSSASSKPATLGTAGASGLKIAYINSDTVLKYYDYTKEVKERLEAKGKKLESDLQNRAKALEGEIGAYQRNISNMTIGQAKTVEEDLGKKQQNLAVYQRSLEQEMAIDQAKISEELYGNITSFLKRYGDQNGLEVVLKFNRESDVLFTSPVLDISQDVIKGLNEDYKVKKSSPVKSDTTASKKK